MRFLRLSVRPGWLQATFSAVNRAVYVYMYAESEWKNNTNIFRTLLLVESRVYEFQRRRKRKRDLHSKIRSLHKKAGFILPGRFFFKKIQRVRRVEDWFSLKKKKKKEKKKKKRKKEGKRKERRTQLSKLSNLAPKVLSARILPRGFFFLILRVSASLQRTAEEERHGETRLRRFRLLDRADTRKIQFLRATRQARNSEISSRSLFSSRSPT